MDGPNLKKNIYFVHEFTSPNGLIPLGYTKETFSSVITNIFENEEQYETFVNSSHMPYVFQGEHPILEGYLIERNKNFNVITTSNLSTIDEINNGSSDDVYVLLFESTVVGNLFEYYGQSISEIENLISPKLLNYFINCSNFKMVFMDSREGAYDHSIDLIDKINIFLDKFNINDENRVIISTNNDNILKLKSFKHSNKPNRINLYNNNYYINMSGRFISEIESQNNIIVENGYEYSLQTEIIYNTKPKYFLMYNRNTARMHRPWFVNLLYKNNLLDKGIYSLIQNDEFEEYIEKYTSYFDLKLNFDDLLELKTNMNNFYPKFIEEENGEIISWYHNFLSRKLEYEQTYFSIVGETNATSKYCFITEKTMKPIMNLHPFFVVGNPETLKQLKKLGFKTFDKWWDESYDLEKDFKKRCNMIIKEVDLLCQKSQNEMHELLKDMEDTLIYNKKHLQKINRYKRFENNFIYEITKKMEVI